MDYITAAMLAGIVNSNIRMDRRVEIYEKSNNIWGLKFLKKEEEPFTWSLHHSYNLRSIANEEVNFRNYLIRRSYTQLALPFPINWRGTAFEASL